MNTSNILETTLLHNGMELGKSAPQTIKGSFFSYLHNLFSGRRKNWGNMIILFMIAAATYFYLNNPISINQAGIYQEMDELMLIPREEPFTALYFEYYDDLPVKVASDETVNFTFTIKNAEGVDKDYTYNIYFKNGVSRKRISVDKRSVFIKNGESKTISESYTFTQDHEQEILFVELPESGQKIHFILKSDEKI